MLWVKPCVLAIMRAIFMEEAIYQLKMIKQYGSIHRLSETEKTVLLL